MTSLAKDTRGCIVTLCGSVYLFLERRLMCEIDAGWYELYAKFFINGLVVIFLRGYLAGYRWTRFRNKQILICFSPIYLQLRVPVYHILKHMPVSLKFHWIWVGWRWWVCYHLSMRYTLCYLAPVHMMPSSNGNIFRVTGPLYGEFTDHRGIPRTKASDAELWYFLLYAPE